jgi:hypothetical protein
MAVNQPADTIAAVSNKMFIRRELSRPWARKVPVVQLLVTEDLTPERVFNIAKMMKSVNPVNNAEAYKWGVQPAAPPFTEAEAGQDIYYNRTSSYNFVLPDGEKDASNTPFLAHMPMMVPASDLDVFASATENENAIPYVYSKQVSYLHLFAQKMEASFVATAQVANKVNSLFTEVKNSGVSCGIDPVDYPAWISDYVNVNGRDTIDAIAERIRRLRRLGKNPTVALYSPGAHDLLIREARSLGHLEINLVEAWGRKPDGTPMLELDMAFPVFRIEGVVFIPSEAMAAHTKALILSMDQIALKTSGKANFKFLPWKNVELESGENQQRAMYKTNHFIANFDRSAHMLRDNVSNS